MSADNSFQARIQRLRERTLATFHRRNPTIPEAGRAILDESTRVSRRVGQIAITIQPPEGPAYTVEPCCVAEETCEPVCDVTTEEISPVFFPCDLSGDNGGIPVEFMEGYLSDVYGTPITITAPEGYPYELFITVVFPQYCNAINYSVNITVGGEPITFQSNQYGASSYDGFPYGASGFGGAFVIFPNIDLSEVVDPVVITLTASNSCSSSTGDAEFFCFLAGAPVALAGGGSKPIEQVVVGDRVVGAFGEINTVTGTISNNLGFVSIININGEHKTTAPHPHITTERKLSSAAPTALKLTYGNKFPVTGADGVKEKRAIKGVNSERITKLEIGTTLQTLTGPRVVSALETIRMPPSTRVYHLTTDGSHSYTVDGYAVAGGATEDDFDYDTWTVRTSN